MKTDNHDVIVRCGRCGRLGTMPDAMKWNIIDRRIYCPKCADVIDGARGGWVLMVIGIAFLGVAFLALAGILYLIW